MNAGEPNERGWLGSRVGQFFSRREDWRIEASACIERCLAASSGLEMYELRAEALMLRARLPDADAATMEGALAEAHDIAARLDWLPLKQRVNAEMRRLAVLPRRDRDAG